MAVSFAHFLAISNTKAQHLPPYFTVKDWVLSRPNKDRTGPAATLVVAPPLRLCRDQITDVVAPSHSHHRHCRRPRCGRCQAVAPRLPLSSCHCAAAGVVVQSSQPLPPPSHAVALWPPSSSRRRCRRAAAASSQRCYSVKKKLYLLVLVTRFGCLLHFL